MIVAVWAPLLLPFLAVLPARRLAEALSPRAAVWTLAATAAVLAGGTLCSLGLLTVAGLLRLPPVAALGHLSPHWLAAGPPGTPTAAAVSAALALAALVALGLRTVRLRRRDLDAARTAVDATSPRAASTAPTSTGRAAGTAADAATRAPGPPHGPNDQHPDTRPPRAPVRWARTPWTQRVRRLLTTPPATELAVLPDEQADAFALPGRPRRPGRPAEPGRIVVTAGMLRALDAPERAALLAHERAHLTARHHLFLALAAHAAAAHPALRALRAPLGYHLERWADESAAARVGDRRVTARAVGRAALAAGRSPWPGRPRHAPAAHGGPVPRRVAALLHPRPAGAVAARRTAALALTACLALTAVTCLDATADLHHTVETAQQQTPAR
ncbi:M48 family metalloprotease [Kitasatospora sp. NPDC004723]|uniref:M48 family metalloprotease n=1 Tax=Kitasatospora sp. NPDC004723 TaxID=3154288 RepID=UPI0033B23965